MNIHELEMRRLLPGFMQMEETATGLCKATDEIVPDAVKGLPVLTKWDQVDNMTHQQLDEMAWELGVLWYDAGATLEVKRRLIKNSDKVWSTLGTRWAVEEVISSYFGDATMQEFWEYEGGRPHYFRIVCGETLITEEREALFLRALGIVKRRSQWLEAIVIGLSALGQFNVGFAVGHADISRHVIGSDNYRQYIGAAMHRAATETVTITRQARDIPGITVGLHEGPATLHASRETHTMKGGN